MTWKWACKRNLQFCSVYLFKEAHPPSPSRGGFLVWEHFPVVVGGIEASRVDPGSRIVTSIGPRCPFPEFMARPYPPAVAQRGLIWCMYYSPPLFSQKDMPFRCAHCVGGAFGKPIRVLPNGPLHSQWDWGMSRACGRSESQPQPDHHISDNDSMGQSTGTHIRAPEGVLQAAQGGCTWTYAPLPIGPPPPKVGGPPCVVGTLLLILVEANMGCHSLLTVRSRRAPTTALRLEHPAAPCCCPFPLPAATHWLLMAVEACRLAHQCSGSLGWDADPRPHNCWPEARLMGVGGRPCGLGDVEPPGPTRWRQRRRSQRRTRGEGEEL